MFLIQAIFGPESGGTDVVAIAGILGTLVGAALGAFVTWKIQQLQLKHENETRFHEHRLATYAEFTAAANLIMAGLPFGADVAEHRKTAIRSWETLRIIASAPVINAAALVHADLALESRGGIQDVTAFTKSYNLHVAHLMNAIRAELGVGSFLSAT